MGTTPWEMLPYELYNDQPADSIQTDKVFSEHNLQYSMILLADNKGPDAAVHMRT